MATRKELTTISVNNNTKEALERWLDPNEHPSWDIFMQDVVKLLKKEYPIED